MLGGWVVFCWCICWVVGTMIFWVPQTIAAAEAGVFPYLVTAPLDALWMVVGNAALSGLGSFWGTSFWDGLLAPFARG